MHFPGTGQEIMSLCAVKPEVKPQFTHCSGPQRDPIMAVTRETNLMR